MADTICSPLCNIVIILDLEIWPFDFWTLSFLRQINKSKVSVAAC